MLFAVRPRAIMPDEPEGFVMNDTLTAAPPRLGLDSNGMRMTPEEFDAVDEYDEQFGYELINGVVVVSPIPSEGEAVPVDFLGYLLWNYREQHANGSALDATLPERYVRVRGSRRKADRVIWAGLGRTPDPDADVPAIVAEFVSERKRDCHRDYVLKKDEYLAAG